MVAKGLRAVLLVLIALLVGGCAGTAETGSTSQYIDDAAITTDVKTALLQDERVSGFGVDVYTSEGRVELNGYVGSRDAKRLAEQIAGEVPGVREVINNLEVDTGEAPGPREGNSSS